MNPLVSIIVPVFNVEKYLKECLDSILNQTYENIEVILVDDGSSDSSGKICDEYLKKDSRIKVFHKTNGGLSDARNYGVENSNGEYIIFVDSDDYLSKYTLEFSIKEIKEQNAEILVFAMKREKKEKEILEYKKNIFNREEGIIELFKGNLYRFSACGKIYKSNIVKKYQFPKGKIHEDQATTYKYFLEANKIVYIDYIGYIYYRRENSILTKKYNIKRLDSFEHWNNIILALKRENFKIREQVYLRYAYWILDNLNYILNSQNKEKAKLKYLFLIKSKIKIYRFQLLRYNKINIKIQLILFFINYKIFYKLKNYRGKNK